MIMITRIIIIIIKTLWYYFCFYKTSFVIVSFNRYNILLNLHARTLKEKYLFLSFLLSLFFAFSVSFFIFHTSIIDWKTPNSSTITRFNEGVGSSGYVVWLLHSLRTERIRPWNERMNEAPHTTQSKWS